MKVTATLLKQWGACWSTEQMRDAAKRLGKGPTPRSVAADSALSLSDRLWVVTKCLWHRDESAARLFAIECAETVAHLAGDDDDQAQFLAITARLREIELVLPPGERAAARATALDAARDAAWAAALDVAIQNAIDRALYWLGMEADK